MKFPQCFFNPYCTVKSVLTRYLPSDHGLAPQTLAIASEELRPILGTGVRGGLDFGARLELYEVAQGSTSGELRPYQEVGCVRGATWDAGSASLHILTAYQLVRVNVDNVVSVVAGSEGEEGDADGPGPSARFTWPYCLTSDGAGTLFVGDADRIRKVQLPKDWLRSGGQATRPAVDVAAAEAGPPEAAQAQAVVTTLLDNHGTEVFRMTYVPASCSSSGVEASPASLVYSSATAVYRLALDLTTGNAAGSPVLLAGSEGEHEVRDGRGTEARFTYIVGIAVDGDGCIYITDTDTGLGQAAVRKLAPDGNVTTVVQEVDVDPFDMAILPNGYLAVCGDKGLVVLELGLPPPRSLPAPQPVPGPPRRTLSGDLSSLLSRQPDGSADLRLLVGGTAFHTHRALLAARCDYFRSRLQEGGFADGAAAELALPDADPDAFALLLRFLYTGGVEIPPAAARGLAELADRLLLPELCADAQAAVLAAVAPEGVVGDMLWAEARGFTGLLGRLKDWYLAHYEQVRREAGPSLKRLMVESPDLMMELVDAREARRAKAARTS